MNKVDVLIEEAYKLGPEFKVIPRIQKDNENGIVRIGFRSNSRSFSISFSYFEIENMVVFDPIITKLIESIKEL